MLRTALLSRSLAPRETMLLRARLGVCSRTFATSRTAYKPALSPDDKAKGIEGFHPKDGASKPKDATLPPKQDANLSTVTGDWVLFHPVYTAEETAIVKVLNRTPVTISDQAAELAVRLLRFGFDLLSGYKHKSIPPDSKMSLEELRREGYTMDEHKWLLRILFLETVAGVPGMVAAVLRHLRSLRRMRRDAGWIHTLLEESENERMHLMTFMTLKQPSIWFRAMVLGAQGVFWNAFFIGYLISPKTCHRFVGKLEEEAVVTYTRLIDDMENGRLPEWENKPAPAIAIDYWRLKADATLMDVIQAVRADEATHRFVNHSLANLKQAEDVNPFALREPDMKLKGTKIGLEREEAAKWVMETRDILESEQKGKPASGNPLETPKL